MLLVVFTFSWFFTNCSWLSMCSEEKICLGLCISPICTRGSFCPYFLHLGKTLSTYFRITSKRMSTKQTNSTSVLIELKRNLSWKWVDFTIDPNKLVRCTLYLPFINRRRIGDSGKIRIELSKLRHWVAWFRVPLWTQFAPLPFQTNYCINIIKPS